MSLIINKDTVLCCSFALKAGSYGCLVHNLASKITGTNMIYKSFSIRNIADAVDSMRILGIRGAGITMPYKKDAFSLVDYVSQEAQNIGAINTIVNNAGKLTGHNTDFVGVKSYLSVLETSMFSNVVVAGTGGMSVAVQASLKSLGIAHSVISRASFTATDFSQYSLIIDATPDAMLGKKAANVIHAPITTLSGRTLALLQASHQYYLYTNTQFPLKEIATLLSEDDNTKVDSELISRIL